MTGESRGVSLDVRCSFPRVFQVDISQCSLVAEVGSGPVRRARETVQASDDARAPGISRAVMRSLQDTVSECGW
jgi:hypothetical protein